VECEHGSQKCGVSVMERCGVWGGVYTCGEKHAPGATTSHKQTLFPHPPRAALTRPSSEVAARVLLGVPDQDYAHTHARPAAI
jgi:hypothetical protein